MFPTHTFLQRQFSPPGGGDARKVRITISSISRALSPRNSHVFTETIFPPGRRGCSEGTYYNIIFAPLQYFSSSRVVLYQKRILFCTFRQKLTYLVRTTERGPLTLAAVVRPCRTALRLASGGVDVHFPVCPVILTGLRPLGSWLAVPGSCAARGHSASRRYLPTPVLVKQFRDGEWSKSNCGTSGSCAAVKSFPPREILPAEGNPSRRLHCPNTTSLGCRLPDRSDVAVK